jgi:hypothetical protein
VYRSIKFAAIHDVAREVEEESVGAVLMQRKSSAAAGRRSRLGAASVLGVSPGDSGDGNTEGPLGGKGVLERQRSGSVLRRFQHLTSTASPSGAGGSSLSVVSEDEDDAETTAAATARSPSSSSGTSGGSGGGRDGRGGGGVGGGGDVTVSLVASRGLAVFSHKDLLRRMGSAPQGDRARGYGVVYTRASGQWTGNPLLIATGGSGRALAADAAGTLAPPTPIPAPAQSPSTSGASFGRLGRQGHDRAGSGVWTENPLAVVYPMPSSPAKPPVVGE